MAFGLELEPCPLATSLIRAAMEQSDEIVNRGKQEPLDCEGQVGCLQRDCQRGTRHPQVHEMPPSALPGFVGF